LVLVLVLVLDLDLVLAGKRPRQLLVNDEGRRRLRGPALV
jgi:hypothetical protein